MKTVIELEIEESLLEKIDEAAAVLGVNRDVFMSTAIKHVLRVHYPKESTARDEINTFLLWMAGDDEMNGWAGMHDRSDPWDEPDNSRLN